LSKWVYGYALPLKIVEKLALQTEDELLHIGSGTGQTSLLICRRFGCRVTGVELSPQIVDVASRRSAQKKLNKLVSFRFIDDILKHARKYRRVFLESVLSYLENPANLLNHVVDRGCRLGLLELVWKTEPTSEDVLNASKVFGAAKFVETEHWKAFLHDCGFHVVDCGEEDLTLSRKLLDDLKISPTVTVRGIAASMFKALTVVEAREQLGLFLSFFRKLSRKMCCGYCIADA